MTLKEMSAILNKIVAKCSPDMDYQLITDRNDSFEELNFESVSVVRIDGLIVDISRNDIDAIPALSVAHRYIWLNTGAA